MTPLSTSLGFFSAPIDQLYRILDALGEEPVTTATVWRKSNIQHTRMKPMIERLLYLGFVEQHDTKGRLRRGITKATKFWTITPGGTVFKEALDLYVKP